MRYRVNFLVMGHIVKEKTRDPDRPENNAAPKDCTTRLIPKATGKVTELNDKSGFPAGSAGDEKR